MSKLQVLTNLRICVQNLVKYVPKLGLYTPKLKPKGLPTMGPTTNDHQIHRVLHVRF